MSSKLRQSRRQAIAERDSGYPSVVVDRLDVAVARRRLEPLVSRFDGSLVDRGAVGELAVSVNGRALLDLVRDVERPYAAAEGQEQLAGDYAPLSGYHFPVGLFAGSPADPQLGYGRYVALLGCTCGEIGCWPLLVRITVDRDEVVWSGFHQPHRPKWVYSRIGEMRFDRRAYEASVAAAEARFAEVAIFPPDLARYHARGRREQIEIEIEIVEGYLVALARLDDVPVVPDEQRQRVWEEPSKLDDARRVLRARLGLTERQAMAVSMKDMHSFAPEDVEQLRKQLAQALAALEDN